MDDISTRDRILVEAEQKFINEGIQNTQMKDIAEALNINRRTLYRYFPTKDDLAFEIEIIVMKQLSEKMNIQLDEYQYQTGYEKVKAYFESVDLDAINEQIRFTAEFDRYFQNEYPSKENEQRLLEVLNPEHDTLYHFIAEGRDDGSIRSDLTASELYNFISQSFLALFQRLLLRKNHLNVEYCKDVDFKEIFKKITLSGIVNRL